MFGIDCLSQTRHSIFLQAEQSLVAILCLIQSSLSYSLELGTDIFTNTSLLSLTTTDNTTVHGTRDAVLLLDVELGKSVLYASRGQSRKLRSYTEASRISL